MRKTMIAAWVAALLMAPQAVLAWGANGHRIVGRVAEEHISPITALAVIGLLGSDSLAEVSTWADEVRSDPAWRQADPWHWVSIEDGMTYDTSPHSPDGDVIEAIRRFTAVLADPAAPRAERAIALRFLVHFVGDIHQPLHVGRAADRGGNLVDVSWFGQPTDLHDVWDSRLIEHDHLSFSEYARFLDPPSRAEVAAWRSASVLDWAAESQAVRSQVYEIGDGNLSWGFVFRQRPLVERRLLQAGVRLAGLLDAIFDRLPGEAPPG